MARIQAELQLSGTTWQDVDRDLQQLDILARGPVITAGMRAVGSEINRQVRRELPKPGYPGDKAGLAPLRNTLRTRTKNYQGGAFKVVIVGYTRPSGAHGHLLEGGHRIVRRGKDKGPRKPRAQTIGTYQNRGTPVGGYVQAYEYMVRIVRNTKSQQNATMIAHVKKALAKVKSK